MLAMAIDASGAALVAYATQLEQFEGNWSSDIVYRARQADRAAPMW